MTDEQLDVHLDKILRAAGSALKHYSMQKTKDDMRQALREALAQPEQEPDGYVQTVIDALYENSDPVSVEAAELLERMAQPEQKPVAMKFKIYKPTVPDPMRQGINNALLPWVYDQDRSSGFDASMWVTPVATLPPQRTWVGLTNNDLQPIAEEYRILFGSWVHDFARAIEAKLKEKNT